MPPRAGKSYTTSLFCAWTLGKKPEDSVMRNTCTATLYQKFSYDVRDIVKSQKFKEVFPITQLQEDKQNLDGWRLGTSRQVGYFGAGVGGTIIGFGASALAITDDLYKSMEDALSDTINDKVHSWKHAAHDSRLESGCPTIDIGTRWSIRDVIGSNIRDNRYDKIVVIPALINERSFCEHVKTTEEYLKTRSEIDIMIWSAEYMQEPIEAKGALFTDLKYFSEAPTEIEGKIAYIDVADEGNDYLAMAIGSKKNDLVYITDVLFTKANTDITIPLCVDILNTNNVNYCRIESNSMGAMFARMVKEKVSNTTILTAHSTANKHTRIIMDAGFIKEKFLFLEPNKQPQEYKQFMQQVLSYSKEGKSKHDDAPDCLSGLAILYRSLFGS